MRIVESAADFTTALASAKREAKASFGDDTVLIEKYLTRPRHIEMQVFADTHGNCVHLFERDCSVQRRHQKVVEEAPAPGMDPARRQAMGAAAIAAAKAVAYVGAGTIEFIAEGDDFFFMEMNTRLQVEHPVTEMISGSDLVEWQLRVAAGERLPKRQDELAINGHAIEVRLYAEDPSRDFLPATGTLRHLRAPVQDGSGGDPHIRVDTGVREGDAVSIHYDPMIAKLVAWGEDRAAALRRLRVALDRYEIVGVTTNRDFLARVASAPEFVAGGVDTGFIARHRDALIPPPAPAPSRIVAAAALGLLLDQAAAAKAAAAASPDPYSPWHSRQGWRLNGDTYQDVVFLDGEQSRALRAHYRGDGFRLDLDDRSYDATATREGDGAVALSLDGIVSRVRIVRGGSDLTLFADGASYRLIHRDPLAPQAAEELAGGKLTAPMPGRIIQVLVATQATVRRGEILLVLEAMKMEHSVTAPSDGIVERLNYAVGDLVEEGAELLVLALPEDKAGS
jgi:3-methylcrotonyl-CoA carboxylase alpha subunit